MIPLKNSIDEQGTLLKSEPAAKVQGFQSFLLQQHIEKTDSHETNVLVFIAFALSHGYLSQDGKWHESEFVQAILAFKQSADQSLSEKRISSQEREELLFSLDLYVRFLRTQHASISLNQYLLQDDIPAFEDLGCLPFRLYIEELCRLKKLCVGHDIADIKRFLKLLGPDIAHDITTLTPVHMSQLEDRFLQRIDDGVMLPRSAYHQLKVFRRFLRFLKQHGYIDFEYIIPEQFDSKIVRENSYVALEDRMSLLREILQDTGTPNQTRDLCIVLLLILTGCRPLEVCTMRIQDVIKTESRIFLYSIKSAQRSLVIDKDAMHLLASYMKDKRSGAGPADPLFVRKNGLPLQSNHVTKIVGKYSKNIQTTQKVTARALRHTFITNALDDASGNNPIEVSEAAGHTSLRSTMHYYYQNIRRLIRMASPYLSRNQQGATNNEYQKRSPL
ncbi:tyrosine-type recombinase/integrase [Paenibacillus sp. MAH-36]|uniref:Site-specific integrase n=1 Tax=Paenibacillus violae TaxID=3077234 RepID=A0ABU3RNU0_9BACL|nr:site-specific integrase [Paenibacillus sp. PFR10]MDU0205818.1 site-specific integrase [Paenibacillus sp. PFR10]